LIREVKRLQALGDHGGTFHTCFLECANDQAPRKVIIQALKVFGTRHALAGVQAQRAERYRQSTVDELKFMGKENAEGEV
jgi:hypothetical protein